MRWWLWVLLVIFIALFILQICDLFRYVRLNHINLMQLDRQYKHLPRVNSKHKVIISMTTTPDRIDKLRVILASLLDQSRKVDAINLYVPYTSLKGIPYHIPNWLTKLKHVHIKRVKQDLGPGTKVLPALKEEAHNTRIIVVDDDIIYGSRLVENLVNMFERFKGKRCITNVGQILDKNYLYINIPLAYFKASRFVEVLQGFSGFIVTPNLFPLNKIFDYSDAPSIAKFVDDVWLSGWLHYNKVPIYQLGWGPKNMAIAKIPRCTLTALGATVNKGFVNEPILIKWFLDVHNISFKLKKT